MEQRLRDKKILFALGAWVLWGFWAFLPKLAMQKMALPSVLFYESIGYLFVTVPALFFMADECAERTKGGIISIISSTMSMAAIFFYHYALKAGAVSTIVTLTAMYPVVTAILARLFFKEAIQPRQAFAIFIGLIAIALLAV